MAAEPLGRLETAQLMARLGRKLPPISRLYGIKLHPEDVARVEVGLLKDGRPDVRSKGAPAITAKGGGCVSLPNAQGGLRKIGAEKQVVTLPRPRKLDDEDPVTSRKLDTKPPKAPSVIGCRMKNAEAEASSRHDSPCTFDKSRPPVSIAALITTGATNVPQLGRARDLAPALPKPLSPDLVAGSDRLSPSLVAGTGRLSPGLVAGRLSTGLMAVKRRSSANKGNTLHSVEALEQLVRVAASPCERAVRAHPALPAGRMRTSSDRIPSIGYPSDELEDWMASATRGAAQRHEQKREQLPRLPASLQSSEGQRLPSSERKRLRKRYQLFIADDSPLWAERRAARARRQQELAGISDDVVRIVGQSAAK